MKKVTALVGSALKRNTHEAVMQFLNNLQSLGDVESEIVRLGDFRLGVCRGCRLCFEKGEEFCPLKDDRDVLMAKMDAADGVVFATPNYTWQMSGLTKLFLDRLGFACHRPRYFGKSFTSIVTQGFMRGEKIVETLDFAGSTLGFNTVKGSCLTILDPRTEKDQRKIDQTLLAHSRRFYASLMEPVYPVPSWMMLIGFRMSRTSIQEMLDERSLDYRYYAAQGWFDSDYFYPTHLPPLKKAAGILFDRITPTIRKLIAA